MTFFNFIRPIPDEEDIKKLHALVILMTRGSRLSAIQKSSLFSILKPVVYTILITTALFVMCIATKDYSPVVGLIMHTFLIQKKLALYLHYLQCINIKTKIQSHAYNFVLISCL